MPGRVRRADRGERLGTVADDPGHRGERLDVVDDGRHVVQAALGRVRRALLGLAALALERLEQHGLLAEHVGALDGLDADHDVVAGPEHVVADEAGILGRPDGGLQSPDRLGRVGPDRDDRLGRADREGGDGRALDDRERVVLEQEAIRAGRRVRAVAVDHDVAARGVGRRRGPPLDRGREPGAAPAAEAGAGDRRDRGRPAEVADHPPEPVERAATNGRIEIERIRRARAFEEDGRPRPRGPEEVHHRLGLRRLAGGPRAPGAGAREGRVQRAEIGRLGWPVVVHRGPPARPPRRARSAGGCNSSRCRRSSRTTPRSAG